MLAEFLNPGGYNNGQDLHDMLAAQGQANWFLMIAIGCLLFIAFSGRFTK